MSVSGKITFIYKEDESSQNSGRNNLLLSEINNVMKNVLDVISESFSISKFEFEIKTEDNNQDYQSDDLSQDSEGDDSDIYNNIETDSNYSDSDFFVNDSDSESIFSDCSCNDCEEYKKEEYLTDIYKLYIENNNFDSIKKLYVSDQCSICLDPIFGLESIILDCDHNFHNECLSKIKQKKCPLCRVSFEYIEDYI